MCSCHCMMCNRDGRVFNISGVYGNQTRTIKEELLTLFGDEAEEYLKDSDVMCAVCETLLNGFVNIRSLWYQRMVNHPSCRSTPKVQLQPVHYGKIWDAFSSELQKGEQINSWAELSTPPSVLSGANSPLLVPKRESSYDPVSEKILSEKFQNEALCSRPPSSCSADLEVEETFKRKHERRTRRRKGRRKNNRKSSASMTSEASSSRKKSRSSSEQLFVDWEVSSQYSSCSNLSSLQSSPSPSSTMSESPSRMITRSSTRYIMEEVQRAADDKPPKEVFTCDMRGCPENKEFANLEELTYHKHEVHKMCWCCYCDQCRRTYVCEEDFERHKKSTHDECLNHCLFCGIPFLSRKQLLAHHEQHFLHSVKCLYCDRAFLYKRECEQHKKNHHHSGEKKIRNQNPRKLILERIDYDYDFYISD